MLSWGQMKKIKWSVVTDPIFMVDYLIQRGGSLQSAIDRFAKFIKVPSWEVSQCANHRGHFGAHLSHRAGVIWLHEKAGTNTITHEVCHATHHTFTGLQISEFSQTDELFAHYSAWLASEIVRRLF